METTDQDNSVLIDSILDEALRCVRRGEIFEVEEYCQRYPELADELRVMLPALTMLEKPRQDSTAAGPAAALAMGLMQLDLADFEIISEIGRGAMGVVYEAIQKPLGRRVALKVMMRAGNANAAQPLRFQQEAEIAARLHHTNIIPVFEAGETAGYVYYAMQLIDGANLQQLIASRRRPTDGKPVDFPGRRASKSDETALHVGSTEKGQTPAVTGPLSTSALLDVDLSPKSCARIAWQVAEGLEFAHQRGVLHRDIKPSNIMLDQNGRAWIADFGLAKSSDGAELTATGDVVGTIRYLAPERFRGQSDHCSDIYALGLTLFESLEGRPAFGENDRARLIARILEGAVPEFTVKIPADLATICFKCIQQAPADRYSTAGELASDLRKFLDGQPIAARPLSLATKILRWCGRNRLISALMVMIVVVAGYGSVTSWRHSWDMQRVTAESKASSLLANRNHLDLLKTVDRFCQTVSEDRRVFRSDFRELRNLLLESANELSTQTAGQVNVSESERIQQASIFQRLGKMRTSDDTLADSEGFLRQALVLLLELALETREEPNVAIEIAGTHRQLAMVYRQMGQNDSAQTNVLESIRILDQVLERDDLESDAKGTVLAELAWTFSVRGDILFDLRKLEDSETAMLQSVEYWKEKLLTEPENLDAMLELANQWTRLGSLLVGNLKKWREAEKPFGEAIWLYRFLDERMPERPDLDFWLGQTLTKKAKWFFIAGQLENAITTQRSTVEIFEEQHLMFELDLAVQLELGISLRQLASFLSDRDLRDPEIFLLLDRSEKILSLAVAGDPENLAATLSLQSSYQVHAEALRQIDDNATALDKIDLAIQTLDRVLELNSGVPTAIEDRYFASVTRAELLTTLSRYDDALLEWDVALKYAPAPFIEIATMNRTKSIALAGKPRQATEQAEAILARQPAGSRQDRHLLSGSAITFAIAAQVVLLENDNPDSVAQSERYAQRAVELLENYRNNGGKVAGVLANQRELEFLVDRPDFQALMQPVDEPEK